MQKESADELLWGYGDGVAILGVETDTVVVHADKSPVGDANPVGVETKVFENLLGSTEGSLCIDDPVLAVELVFKAAEVFSIAELGGISAKVEF
ncbi:hypothetical protein LCGC14_2346800, partial [marine sediment metagenome]